MKKKYELKNGAKSVAKNILMSKISKKKSIAKNKFFATTFSTQLSQSIPRKLSLLASSALVLASQSAAAMPEILPYKYLGYCECWNSYVGMDVAWRHQGINKEFGGNIVKKDFPQGDVYFGIKYRDVIGFQVGFESTVTRRKTTNLLGSDILFGAIVDEDDLTGLNQVAASSKIYGWHADLAGFLPFCIQNNSFNLIGTIGIAKLRYDLQYYNPIIRNRAPVSLATTFRTTSCSRYVPRIGLGIQYMLTDCVGLRFMGSWEKTSRLRNFKTPPENLESNIIMKLKNATTLGLGISYTF